MTKLLAAGSAAALLVTAGVRPQAAHVVSTSAPDHLPVVADLEIPRSPNGPVR